MDSSKGSAAEEFIQPSSSEEVVSGILNTLENVRQDEKKEIFALITQDKKWMVDELKSSQAIVQKVVDGYPLALSAVAESVLLGSSKSISAIVAEMEKTKECVVDLENPKDLKEEKKSVVVEQASDQGNESQSASEVTAGDEE